MTVEAMKEILKKEYGIESQDDLNKIMREYEGVNIGLFTSERGKENDRHSH